ncbi:hypothetical protein, variant 1 [Phialophora macrospora]|nr:hypothetical protein, variant 1 [Phialophora macrospora]
MFPADKGYQSQQARYWASNQADFTPSCRISPTTSEEVGTLVSQLVEFGDDVKFAVSSGGHATAFGASNIDDGITLDLSALDSVSLASDRSYVDVGTGARWLDVYRALDPWGLTVAGGRAASVGVGGYLLGGMRPFIHPMTGHGADKVDKGGISLFSSLCGWGADSVDSIEVVLANGTIVTASASTHSDLLACLKGGANNFGIAISFRIKTFPTHGLLRVSLLQYAHEHLPAVLDALSNFTQNAHLDLNSASADLSVGFDTTLNNPEHNNTVYMLMLTRLIPLEEQPDVATDEKFPQLWQSFFDIPTLSTSTWRSSMSDVAQLVEMSNPYGFRVYKTTMTVRNDAILLARITDLVTTSLQDEAFVRGEPVLQAGLLVQPLTLPHLRYARDQAQAEHQGQGQGLAQAQAQAQGPRNLMLLEDEAEALILLSLEAHYLHSGHSARYTALMDGILAQAEHLARSSNNALHPFRYGNYAAKGQDVWGLLTRGEKEHTRRILDQVRDVQRRYDPIGVWENMLSGGFRIPSKA